MLTVTVPAADANLIPIEDLRVVAGYAAGDATHDDELKKLSSRLTAEIVAACNIAVAKGAVPTLRRETLVQTFRLPSSSRLVLARRHEVEISSVILDNEALASGEFEVDAESGLLSRISGGYRTGWCGRAVAVTYVAGFSESPADLAAVSADLARYRLSENSRDPLVKSESLEINDIQTKRVDYWVGSLPGITTSSSLPSDLMARLRRYTNAVVV